MDIIIRKSSVKPMFRTSSAYQNFTPHWNTSLDKKPVWVGSRKEYDQRLKKGGYKIYDRDEQVGPKLKEYAVSKDTRRIVNAIKSQTDKRGNLNPSGALMKELISRKVIQKKSDVSKMQTKIAKHVKEGI